MRGPNWTDPTRGVTGELKQDRRVTSEPNYETRVIDGKLTTVILGREEEDVD